MAETLPVESSDSGPGFTNTTGDHALDGTFLLYDIKETAQALANHDWASLALIGVADGFDAAATISDPFGSLLTVAAAPGDLVVLFDKLAKVAPDEIQSEVEAIHDSLKDQQDAMGDAIDNPLGAIGSSLISGLTNAGSYQAVDEYTPDLWAMVLEPVRFADARDAVVQLAAEQEWIHVSHIVKRVKLIRHERIRAFGTYPEPPAELSDAEYVEWHRRTTRAIGDGTLQPTPERRAIAEHEARRDAHLAQAFPRINDEALAGAEHTEGDA